MAKIMDRHRLAWRNASSSIVARFFLTFSP
jgi:hypothetical protein